MVVRIKRQKDPTEVLCNWSPFVDRLDEVDEVFADRMSDWFSFSEEEILVKEI